MENWDIQYSNLVGLKDENSSKQIRLGLCFCFAKNNNS